MWIQGPLVTAKGTDNASKLLLDFPEQASTSFQPQTFFKHLNTKSYGSVLLVTSALPSTQTLLQDNPGFFPHGTVCVADRQVKGRGASNHFIAFLNDISCSLHNQIECSIILSAVLLQTSRSR